MKRKQKFPAQISLTMESDQQELNSVLYRKVRGGGGGGDHFYFTISHKIFLVQTNEYFRFPRY